MRRILLVLGLSSLAAAPACAQPAMAQPTPEALTFNFATYAAGLNVVNFQGSFSADAREYRLDLVYHTAGLFGAVIHSDMDTRVNGVWTDNTVSPLQFYSWGHIRGVPRRTLIEYANGQPLIRDLQPPNEEEREPVPAAEQHDTVDSLSAIALLMRHVADTGRCDGAITTFDGRRLARITVRTGGEDMLSPSHGSRYAGPALRCDFVGQQLAGFRRDDDPDVVRRPHRGSAWFARLMPGAMPVPVRLSFRTQWFGDAVAYLTKVTQNGSAQQ
jgi:hypothetical protein